MGCIWGGNWYVMCVLHLIFGTWYEFILVPQVKVGVTPLIWEGDNNGVPPWIQYKMNYQCSLLGCTLWGGG